MLRLIASSSKAILVRTHVLRIAACASLLAAPNGPADATVILRRPYSHQETIAFSFRATALLASDRARVAEMVSHPERKGACLEGVIVTGYASQGERAGKARQTLALERAAYLAGLLAENGVSKHDISIWEDAYGTVDAVAEIRFIGYYSHQPCSR